MPDGEDALSSAWLSNLLEESLEVREATRIGQDYGLAGVTHRVVAATGRGGSRSFVVKQDSAANVERELLFRSHCEELVRGSVAECLGAVADSGSGRGALVLEDIAPAEQGDVLRGCSDAQAEAIVRALARVHGAEWKRLDEGFPKDLPRWAPRPREPEVWLDRLGRASGRFPEILTPRLRARLHELPERPPAGRR